MRPDCPSCLQDARGVRGVGLVARLGCGDRTRNGRTVGQMNEVLLPHAPYRCRGFRYLGVLVLWELIPGAYATGTQGEEVT